MSNEEKRNCLLCERMKSNERITEIKISPHLLLPHVIHEGYGQSKLLVVSMGNNRFKVLAMDTEKQKMLGEWLTEAEMQEVIKKHFEKEGCQDEKSHSVNLPSTE